jgi:class 3 adenylate cyclase
MLEVTAGLALQTARALRLDVQPLVLWDEQPGRGPGGTSDFVEFWEQKLGKKHCVIKMPRAESKSASRYEPGTARRAERRVLRQEVKTMLFADIVGYSKIKEHAIPNFVTGFLDRASQLAAASRHAPQNVSTWGDAIYAVFDFAVDAGNFALELTQLIHANSKEWEQLELYWDERASGDRPAERQPLNIRIGLHTGPVFQHYNPLVRQLGFTGAHVSRAARIEPVTQRGEVFASEEFAALVEMDSAMRRHQAEKKPLPSGSGRANSQGDETDPAAFVCEYVGSMPLAKDYPGLHRIYRLVPTRRFDIEELARVIHDRYCREQRKAGKIGKDLPALRPWTELSENMREASREQAADIPYKLRELGYDLTRRGGIDPNQIAPEPERASRKWPRESTFAG